ncbi:hypothetical protein BDR07DRAFT_1391666 [Suillus spraguei]|nr:hypothetical protein BDR07DRAFT_1391666 [Suillus spraguei]
MSARLAEKVHPFILTKSRNIYPYLASKDSLHSAESLQKEYSGAGSSTRSTSTLKKKGLPRNINLADDAAKTALMEEWANLRMSQGTLLSVTSAGEDTTPQLSSNRRSREPHNAAEIPSGEVAEPNTSHPAPASDHMEHTDSRPSGSPPNQLDEPLPDSDIPAKGLVPHNSLPDYDLRYPSSSPENIHPMIEYMAPSQHANVETGETIVQASHIPVIGSPEVVDPPLQLLATDSKTMALHPQNSLAGASSAVEMQLVVSSQADIEDVVLGFHMLDLHEVLSPWVPVSPAMPSIYVPPAVQHLFAAMNRQLEIECQARKRAEELYLDEMRKRIQMEEVVDRLQRERGQTQELGTPQQPPSLHASPRTASASPEEAGQRDGETQSTPIDTTYPSTTTEGSCA